MDANLSRSLKFVFGHEGDFDNDPHDRGNWTSGLIGQGQLKGTKYGIASHVYPNLDIRNLTFADAEAIYARDYAPKVAYAQQPSGVDHTQLDIAINAGYGRANQLQSKALGVPNGTSPRDLAARALALPDKVPHIKRVNALMLSFYQGLKTFPRYGRGWTRRNAEREALSVKWALEAANANVPAGLDKEKQKADTAKKGNATAAGGAGGAGAGGASQTDPSQLDPARFDPSQFNWLPWAVLVIAVGVTLYFAWHAYRNSERAKAYVRLALGAIGG